jgi:phosphoglycolate phosphatase-like HAD superfamily hydrolase
MSDAPTVLIDCDGVIVDNLKFEQRVTELIIEAYAAHCSISLTAAELNWRKELSVTRGNERWYDYAYHATRLGLDGPKVARKAHYLARDLLKLVKGADATLGFLQEYGLQTCVVTDATRWVVEFKLSALGLSSMLSLFSSSDASATKASGEYWKELSRNYPGFKPIAFVDNRRVNLATANQVIGLTNLLQFDKEEHVMTLSSAEAPTSDGFGQERIQVVRNHEELQSWLANFVL